MSDPEPIKRHLEGLTPEMLKARQNIIIEGADFFTDGGYIQYPRVVHFDSRIDPASRTCYAIILHMTFNHERFVNGQKAIEAYWGVSTKTVSRALAKLQNLGWIEVRKRRAMLSDEITVKYAVTRQVDEVATASKVFKLSPRAFDHLKAKLTVPVEADIRTRFGWIEVPAILYDNSKFDISDGDRAVYSTLLSFSKDGESAFPKQDTIARKLGRSTSTIEDNIGHLKAAGLLTSQRKDGSFANEYHLNLRVNQKRRNSG